jgi:hypothetical protein
MEKEGLRSGKKGAVNLEKDEGRMEINTIQSAAHVID